MLEILIVDDETMIREVVKEYAKVSGYLCDEAEDGQQALEKVKLKNYDCIIMDIMMPGLDGYSASREIRKITKTPIIMLSARQEEDDKLLGFDIGIDDYVTKPFSPKELMARIKVVSERNPKMNKDMFVLDTLVLDMKGRTLKIDGSEVLVTPKELDLLIYLIQNKNIAMNREMILSSVWGYYYEGDDRTVDTHIKMLRKSLRQYKDHIVTVRSIGYKFED